MRLGTFLITAGVTLVGAAPAHAVSADPGDVIVGDSDKAKVFTLDPKSGKRKVLSQDSRFADPNDSAFSPNGKRLYVADYDAFGGEGGVFRINPNNGKTRVLAKKDGFAQPDGIAVAPDGDVWVTDLDATGDDGALFRVDKKSGDVDLVASGGGLADAVGVVVPPHGKPIVSSLSTPVIVRVNPSNGNQKTIADASDGLTGTGGIARGSDGTIYIATGTGTLEAVDPQTADVTEAATGFATNNYGLAIDRQDRVLGADGDEVFRAKPGGGVKLIGEGFDYAEGLEVVPR